MTMKEENYIKQSLSRSFLFCSQLGMIEFIGILEVKVKKGTNLAIRDFRSSDPYVVLTLGQQVIMLAFL
jgi:hypothetical protein